MDRERNEILQKSAVKMTDVLKKLSEDKGYDIVIDAPYAPYFKAATGHHPRSDRGIRQGVSGGCSGAQEVSHNR